MTSKTEACVDIIRERIGDAAIDVGLIICTGMGATADQVTQTIAIPYADLPGFPDSGGDRKNNLLLGIIGTARIAVFRGRTNYCEAGDINAMRVPLETLSQLGAKAVVIVGTAGSVRAEIQPGAVVVVTDHINLTGLNPLVGNPSAESFVDLMGAYDRHLRERFAIASHHLGRKLYEGVLMWTPGPSFETPAEIRAAQALGADLVAMSLVPEAILARRLGLRVLGLATVTSHAAGLRGEALTTEARQRTGTASASALSRVLNKFFEIWQLESRGIRQN